MISETGVKEGLSIKGPGGGEMGESRKQLKEVLGWEDVEGCPPAGQEVWGRLGSVCKVSGWRAWVSEQGIHATSCSSWACVLVTVGAPASGVDLGCFT